MKIGVLIPVHNESRSIGRLVAGIRAKGLDVVVVDDGSEDRSGHLACEAGAVVIHNPVRKGKGASLQRGFEYFLQNSYDGVIMMDGDGQHDVGDLDLFLEKIQDDPQSVVNGSRMGDTRGMPFIRRVTNRFMSWIISCICRQCIADTQCGFRYVGSDVLRKFELTSSDFEIETEVLIRASQMGCRIFSVPIKTIYEDEQSKIRPVRDTVRFVKFLWRELVLRRISRKNP